MFRAFACSFKSKHFGTALQNGAISIPTPIPMPIAMRSNPETPPGQLKAQERRGALNGVVGSLLLIVVTLMVGLQLGALPWRYRRQFLQLQGALLGGAAGFVLGRMTAGRREPRP